ncbi:MAG: DUF4142 domain-containing protein [Planctomycetales bacterium]
MNSVNRLVIAAGGLLVLSVMFAEAKDKQRRDNPTQPAVSAPNTESTKTADPNAADANKRQKHTANHLDECLATMVIYGNQNEIRASQIAVEKATSPAVKQFAQQMVQQHQEFLTKLEPFGKTGQSSAHRRGDRKEQTAAYRFKNKGQQENETANRDAEKRDSNAQDNKPEKSKIQQTGGTADVNPQDNNRQDNMFAFHHKLGEIHQEMAQQCRQSMEKELNSKTGADFDNCYVGMQIAAHMHMLDSLTVFERHASPELKAVFEQGRQTTQTHLDHAKNLMQTLAKNTQNSPAGQNPAGNK